MANYVSFLTVAFLTTFLIGHSQADITCYLCSTLNTTSGGSCLVPDSTTIVCPSNFNSIVSIGSSNALVPVAVYSVPVCWVVVYYNGNGHHSGLTEAVAQRQCLRHLPTQSQIGWVTTCPTAQPLCATPSVELLASSSPLPAISS